MRTSLPDVKLLHIFEAVVRHQGFAPAQQELGLSASAISTYMAQLERQLGVVLCHRGRGGFSLTSKGALYHGECVRVLAELDRLGRYAGVLKTELHGTLRIGIIDAVATDAALPLPTALARFSSDHPGVYLDLAVRTPHELQVGILNGDIDVAVGTFPSPMPGLSGRPLHREQHWLYCSDAHPLFAAKAISTEVITRQRIVTRGYWSQSELAQQGFTAQAATVENMEAQLILILSGTFIGFLPEHYAQPWLDRNRLKPLRPAAFGHQAQFAAIYRRGHREPLVLSFCEQLRTAADHSITRDSR